MKPETVAEQLLFTTVRLETQHTDGSASVGTGFFFSRDAAKGQVIMIITNRHVIAEARSVRITLTTSDDQGNPILGKTASVNVDLSSWPVVGHPNPNTDVAAILATPVMNQLGAAGTPAFFRSLRDADLITPKTLSELDAIEQVTFVGYPNGLFDTANHLPIVRRGSTATPLGVDYRGEPTFLIDASVFPGSSGSPVLLFDRGVYTDRSNNTTVGARFAVLGVLAAVHIRTVAGKFTEHLTALGVSVDEPIDLGIVFKASTVADTADELLALLKRIEGRGQSGSTRNT